MNCLVAVSVMALFAAAMGQDDVPSKCCISRQFEGVLVQFGGYVAGGKGQVIENYDLLSYDYDAKLLKISEIQMAAGQTTSTVIDDYNSGKRYIIDTNNTCYVSNTPTSGMIQPCIPDNATFIGRGVFGYGNKSLAVNTWHFVDPSSGLEARAAVTEDCVPVMQIVMGVISGAPTELTYIFSNFKPSIADRSVFNLPAADTCKALPTSSVRQIVTAKGHVRRHKQSSEHHQQNRKRLRATPLDEDRCISKWLRLPGRASSDGNLQVFW